MKIEVLRIYESYETRPEIWRTCSLKLRVLDKNQDGLLCMRHDGSLSHKVALQNFIRMLFYKLNVDL